MKKMIKPLLGIVMIVLMLLSCNNGSTEKANATENTENTEIVNSTEVNNGEQINSLITHLNNNGFTGEKSEKSFEMIGAMDGVGYENEEFSIEIYQFEDPKDISKELSHRNGQFGMLIHRPKADDDKIKKMIDVFNSFE